MNTYRHASFRFWIAASILASMFSALTYGQPSSDREHSDPIPNYKDRTPVETVDSNRSGKVDFGPSEEPRIINGSGSETTTADEPERLTATPRTNLIDKTSAPSSQTQPTNAGWEFEVTPYFYATGIRGPVAARGRTLDLDASFGKLFDNLDLWLAGTFGVRKNRFVSLSDLIWLKLSNTRQTPGGLYDTAKVGINLVIIDPEAGYRVVDSGSGSLDMLGGVRVWSLKSNLNTTSGRLPGFDVSQRKTWAAPVVGARGRVNLTSKWFLEGKFDIGGGIGADLTTQVYAGGGYRFSQHIGLIGGYRYLQVDYDDNAGFLFDTKKNGIVLGVRFSF